MIRVSSPRFLTALLVGGLCVFTVSRASSMLEFGVRELFTSRGTAEANLRPFVDDPLVGYLARRDLLDSGSVTDPKAQISNISHLLRLTPLSSEAWLRLAIARRAGGKPVSEIASAIVLSQLTGPNEAALMARRAAFGLGLWSVFPSDLRRVLIGDLVGGGWAHMEAGQREGLSALLQAESPETRQEIYAALLLAGAPGTPIIEALEFAPPEAEKGP